MRDTLRQDLELTAGERIAIRRRRVGATVEETARRIKVPVARLRRWERDEGDDVPSVRPLSVNGLSFRELCRIRRDRLGLTLQDIADALGWGSTARVSVAETGRTGAIELVTFLMTEYGRREAESW